MENKILETFYGLIKKFRIVDVEEVSIACGKYSYDVVLRVLKEHGVPVIALRQGGVPIIVREDADKALDISSYIDRNYIEFDKEDSEYIDAGWNGFPKIRLTID